jgi:hypothetical protein
MRYRNSIAGKISPAWIRPPKTGLLLATRRQVAPKHVNRNLLAMKNNGPNFRQKAMIGLNS